MGYKIFVKGYKSRQLILTYILVLLLSACSKPNSNGPSPVPTGEIKKSNAACVESVKTQMKNGPSLFINASDTAIDDVADAINSDIKTKSVSKSIYRISQSIKDQSIGSISIERELVTSPYQESYSESLSLVPDNTDWPLQLSLSYTEYHPNGDEVTFSQTVNIDSGCNQRLIESVRTDFKKNDVNKVNVTERTHNLSGDQPTLSTQVTVPSGTEYNPKLPEGDSVAELNELVNKLKTIKVSTYLNIKLPSLDIRLAKANKVDRLNPLTGKTESFDGLAASVLNGNTSLLTFGLYHSLTSPFSFQRMGNLDNLSVNEAIWNQTALTIYEEVASRIVHIDKVLFNGQRPLTLKILTNRELDFPNMAAYWSQLSARQLNDPDGWTQEYVLKGTVSQGTIESIALNPNSSRSQNNPFLEETPYIQISLPQSQVLINNLKSGFSGTRLDMAKKILEVVNNTITYDYGMVSDNTVGTLRTSEIFEKKKGVCQHFANLFTTLARGVGIPTRIITGFKIDESSAGRHAWNEIEVRSGVWLPIEPQMRTLDFDYSTYLPVAISTLYDNPDDKDGYTKEIQGLVLTSFKIDSL